MAIDARHLRALILLSALVISSLCIAQTDENSVSSHTDIQAIKSLTDKWLEIAADGDVDGYMNLMAEDFIWLGNSGGPGYFGHAAVRDFLEPFFESFRFSLEDMHSGEIIVSTDRQFAVYEYYGTAVIEAKDGSSTTKTPRKYFDFWTKGSDGKWKCSRHLFVPIG